MRIFIGMFIILSNEALNNGNAHKHVHFKIHVPEIIKHHIHTKTVFVHVHKPDISIPKKPEFKKEPKKAYNQKETHHEDWSSWRTYDYHDDKSNDNLSKDHDDNHKEMIQRQKENPFLPKDSYMPVLQHNNNNNKPDYPSGKHGDLIGYSYPPQYEVHENVKETDHNEIEPYQHAYEESFRKGGESEHGHVYTGDVTKFYEGKHEEGDHSIEDEYKNDSGKTHAGRYFVDDNEYQRDSDKPEKRASYFTGKFALS